MRQQQPTTDNTQNADSSFQNADSAFRTMRCSICQIPLISPDERKRGFCFYCQREGRVLQGEGVAKEENGKACILEVDMYGKRKCQNCEP